jgi:hypothetical protein
MGAQFSGLDKVVDAERAAYRALASAAAAVALKQFGVIDVNPLLVGGAAGIASYGIDQVLSQSKTNVDPKMTAIGTGAVVGSALIITGLVESTDAVAVIGCVSGGSIASDMIKDAVRTQMNKGPVNVLDGQK